MKPSTNTSIFLIFLILISYVNARRWRSWSSCPDICRRAPRKARRDCRRASRLGLTCHFKTCHGINGREGWSCSADTCSNLCRRIRNVAKRDCRRAQRLGSRCQLRRCSSGSASGFLCSSIVQSPSPTASPSSMIPSPTPTTTHDIPSVSPSPSLSSFAPGPLSPQPRQGGPDRAPCTCGTMSATFADPHIRTFDGISYDCQASGEFVLVKSDIHNLEVQGRFAGPDTRGSMTVGIVAKTSSAPPIQISIASFDSDPLSQIVGACRINLFVDGTQRLLDSGTGLDSASVTVNEPYITMQFDNRISISIRSNIANVFGCHLEGLNVFLPDEIIDDNDIRGMLGTPNNNPFDDWTTADGNPIQLPSSETDRLFAAAYNYCTTNWCTTRSSSLFSYDVGKSFDSFNFCDQPYGAPLNFEGASSELRDLCGSDGACLVDGLVGGIENAQAALAIQAEQEAVIRTSFKFTPNNINIDRSVSVRITLDISGSSDPDVTVVDFFNVYSVDVVSKYIAAAPIIQLVDDGETEASDDKLGDRIFSSVLGVQSSTAGESFSFKAIPVIAGMEKSTSALSEYAINAIRSYSDQSDVGNPGDAIPAVTSLSSASIIPTASVSHSSSSSIIVSSTVSTTPVTSPFKSAIASITSSKSTLPSISQTAKSSMSVINTTPVSPTSSSTASRSVISSSSLTYIPSLTATALPSDSATTSTSASYSISPSVSVTHTAMSSALPSPLVSVSSSPTISPSLAVSATVSSSTSSSSSTLQSAYASTTITPSASQIFSPSSFPSMSHSTTVTPTISITSQPTMTGTGTATATITVTSTVAASATITDEISVTPTTSASLLTTPKLSMTVSNTPTISVTPSISGTPSITPTLSMSTSITPTISMSTSSTPSIGAILPTPSNSLSVVPSPTVSATASTTPTISRTPSITPTITVSISVTATISLTPTPTISTPGNYLFTPIISVTLSRTPTISASPTPSYCQSGIKSALAYTDSHIITFDGLRYDCRASGEFVIVKSDQNEFELQARFGGPNTEGSVITGFVVKKRFTPPIQISIASSPTDNLSYQIGSCGLDLFVDGKKRLFSSGTGFQSTPILQSTTIIKDRSTVILRFDDCVDISFSTDSLSPFACFLDRFHVILPDYLLRSGDIRGIFGTPNNNAYDDWTTQDGSPVTTPTSSGDRMFEAAYTYCTTNWCITQSSNSLFSYDSGESFNDYNLCRFSYGVTPNFNEATPQLRGLCGVDNACLVDGLVGGIENALATLRSQERSAVALQTDFRFDRSSIVINFNFSVLVELSKLDRRNDPQVWNVQYFNLYFVNSNTGQIDGPAVTSLVDDGSFRTSGDPFQGDYTFSGTLHISSSTAGESFSFIAIPVIGGTEDLSSNLVSYGLHSIQAYSVQSGLGVYFQPDEWKTIPSIEGLELFLQYSWAADGDLDTSTEFLGVTVGPGCTGNDMNDFITFFGDGKVNGATEEVEINISGALNSGAWASETFVDFHAGWNYWTSDRKANVRAVLRKVDTKEEIDGYSFSSEFYPLASRGCATGRAGRWGISRRDDHWLITFKHK